MIEVGSTLLHEDVVNENFVCNLNKCKGACCLEGDSGAPLAADELDILKEIYPKVKPYMTAKGIATIEREGTHVTDFEGDYTTPCVDVNKECAYVTWENGITKCAIEKACWNICSPACSFGSELKVRVHEFLKEPLIRKYGAEWYQELEDKLAGI
jgi:hypothetical protein